jgi:hypothetical protein
MYLHVITNVLARAHDPGSPRIWLEHEFHVYKVIKFEPGAGKTGKGALHFWETDAKTGRCGQYRAVDAEDVCTISASPTLTKK